MKRKKYGDQTHLELTLWTGDQKSSERLSAHLLSAEGFKSIDPSHPLGGPDGLKDIVCIKDGKKYVAGCSFHRDKVNFAEIKKKFNDDFKGVSKNNADSFAFVTNQKLTVSERKLLAKGTKLKDVCIIHLERMVYLLNQPAYYGIRLEFLHIEMQKEEVLACLREKDLEYVKLNDSMQKLFSHLHMDITASEFLTAPEVEPQPLKTTLTGKRNIHKCTFCHFTFKVKPSQQFKSPAFQMAVECPKCKNLDLWE